MYRWRLRALNVKEFHVLTHAATPEVYEYVNEHCDALIVVSQNSLRPGFFGKYLSRSFLENRMKLPMIFISLGVQFELDDTPYLTEDDVTSVKIIYERVVSSRVHAAQASSCHPAPTKDTAFLAPGRIIYAISSWRPVAPERLIWTGSIR